jgi:type VI protein secretion system component VasF
VKEKIVSFEKKAGEKEREYIDKRCQELHDLIYDLHGICNKLENFNVNEVPEDFRREIARSITDVKIRLRRSQLRLL